MLTQNLPDFWDNLYAEGKDYWTQLTNSTT